VLSDCEVKRVLVVLLMLVKGDLGRAAGAQPRSGLNPRRTPVPMAARIGAELLSVVEKSTAAVTLS
jgi:hypothetical protein